MSKLLCYELNEVPWKVVDLYTSDRPHSNLAKLLNRSAQFTTNTVDGGELHPWTTWPTIHRGVANDAHHIHSLNQDLTVAHGYPPVWEILTSSGKTCGIFGSLQSYPPLHNENMKFHIPDTFAAGPETIPEHCSPFQAFNLMMTGENKARTSRLGIKQLSVAAGLVRSGIKPLTYLKVTKHLFNEKANPLYKKRRALLQPELAFDVFLECMKKNKPEFVTFFSNHVAGVMHRYWKYSFPEDFNYTLDGSESDEFNQATLIAALDLFDKQLGKLIKFSEQHGYRIVVLSSMGQQAIDRGTYVPELILTSFEKLNAKMGINFDVVQNLAMHPDIALEFHSIQDMDIFRAEILKMQDSNGTCIFKERYSPVGNTINYQLLKSKILANDKVINFKDKKETLEDFGLELIERDIGTGYHQPRGILIWEQSQKTSSNRLLVDSRQVLPTILEHFNIKPKEYMKESIQL